MPDTEPLFLAAGATFIAFGLRLAPSDHPTR